MEFINKLGLVFFMVGLNGVQSADGWQFPLFMLVEFVGLLMFMVPSGKS